MRRVAMAVGVGAATWLAARTRLVWEGARRDCQRLRSDSDKVGEYRVRMGVGVIEEVYFLSVVEAPMGRRS